MENRTEHENKVINYSLKLAKFSLIGVLIPFLGLYLAIIALNNIKKTPSKLRKSKKPHLVKSFAISGIIISLISISAWMSYYFIQSNKIKQTNNQLHIKEKSLDDVLNKCKGVVDNESQMYIVNNRDTSKGTYALVYENIPKAVRDKSSDISRQGYEKCYQEFNSSINK